MSIWDEFRQADDRFKFETPGDAIAGTITGLRVATMPDNTRIPQLTIKRDDGTESSVLASQSQLQRKLAALDPQAGQRIAISFTHVEQLQGGKTMKHFDIALKPADASTPQPAAANAGAPSTSAADLI